MSHHVHRARRVLAAAALLVALGLPAARGCLAHEAPAATGSPSAASASLGSTDGNGTDWP